MEKMIESVEKLDVKDKIEDNNNDIKISNSDTIFSSLSGEKVELDLNSLNTKKYFNPKNTKNIIILGMAGSGKTSFVNKFEETLITKEKENYLINLDPAVFDCIYEPNLDIRDTIKYKQVMESYNLGPNGAIITSLNLFSTNIHKVVELLESKKTDEDNIEYVVVDTPGQLEVFSWSASGKLISDSLALVYPTILIYVMDLVRNQNPNVFVSNMLYALSIMYKMQLPLIIVYNKKDVVNEDLCVKWMKDYNLLQTAINEQSDYISSFSYSLCLTLEEFYKTIKFVAVSSKNGDGFEELLSCIDKIIENYNEEKFTNS